eukprot:scaffold22777_cov67-Phaeocystis_antarctica.AAC.8
MHMRSAGTSNCGTMLAAGSSSCAAARREAAFGAPCASRCSASAIVRGGTVVGMFARQGNGWATTMPQPHSTLSRSAVVLVAVVRARSCKGLQA